VQLNDTCNPTVDAEVNVDGAAPGTTVTLEPGHGAHAMVEWVAAAGGPDPTCAIYGPSGADVTLRVTPPGMSQTFTVPISVGRNEGLCNQQITR
jgi:hypothetical protein